jgi:folylpolyglutamate synthase/dihydropteroate synthase
LQEIAGHHVARHFAIPDAEQAVQAALAKAHSRDVIVITGSLYLVGQVRQAWRHARKVASC